MAAKDFYHGHVKTALAKDGWKITDGRFLLVEEQIRLIVFDDRRKEIVKWISWTDIATS
jgi:XisH protein